MKLSVWGAAEQVTGSMHLLETASGFNLLIDCGLDYESKNKFIEINQKFPFNPAHIHAVILTHAHIDHSGNLPNLIKQGFVGPIYCTEPTAHLSEFLVKDSLNIQRIELAAEKRKKGKSKKGAYVYDGELLYGNKHIVRMVDSTVCLAYNKPKQIAPNLQIEFFDAGHIIGSASVKINVEENGKTKTIGFTGDLGNYDTPQMNNPTPMPNLQYLLMESTYGGRLHKQSGKAKDELEKYIIETCQKNLGKLVIPAFSVGRTQTIIYTIHELYREGRIPNVKIYTDSPLAIKATRIYESHLSYLNNDSQVFKNQYGSLFDFPLLHVVENQKESEILSLLPEPAVIVSAAGMVEGGRIQTHVRNNIGSAKNTILIAGFCAPGTLGDRLLQGQSFVEINRKQVAAKAQVARTDAFSAHPDHNGLLNYLKESNYKDIKQVFLVHANKEQMNALKTDLSHPNVTLPQRGVVFDL